MNASSSALLFSRCSSLNAVPGSRKAAMLREPGKKRICPVAVMQKGMRERLRSLPIPRQHGRSSPYRWLYKSFMNF